MANNVNAVPGSPGGVNPAGGAQAGGQKPDTGKIPSNVLDGFAKANPVLGNSQLIANMQLDPSAMQFQHGNLPKK
jgi:hypothetical protein